MADWGWQRKGGFPPPQGVQFTWDEHFYSAFITLPEFDDIWRSGMSSRIKAWNFGLGNQGLAMEYLN